MHIQQTINENEQVRVLLIEDNSGDALLLSKILRESISAKFELTHCKELSEGLRVVAEKEIDVILLDLALPDSHGYETFSAMHLRVPNIPIVVLTGLDDKAMAMKSVQNGAQDYLIKSQISKGLLIRSLLYAIERQKKERRLLYKEKEFNRKMLADLHITKREKEILSLLSEGKSNDEISKTLHLSVSTVRNHLGKIFMKLRISNRSQATAIAVKAGLLELHEAS